MNILVKQKPTSAGAERRTFRGYLLLAGAALTCPCHLPVFLILLAGTGVAGFLTQNFWTAFLVLTAVFVFFLRSGLKTLKTARQENPEQKTG
ncbi:MAG: mercury resistance protein [Candidatus Tectomicrobia bacterium]|uniref:Mercury resistance protein n=1 Tax=Tectimicrobiota bacterium TaxID=2528274 RepID=A0A932M0Z4_UNCTE|nr:mercury resistance protein [Candidatus Tectomicrobia bacterium]